MLFAVDVTDSIHPTIQAAAGCAVAAIGLRVAGLDFICEDASLPLNEGGGCFIEVNTQPGVESHLYPDIGIAHPVCDEIIRFMFQVP